MIFRGKRSRIKLNITVDVDLGYKHIEKFRGETQWFTIESKNFVSNFSFKKSRNGNLMSFKDPSLNFRLSLKEV